MDNKTKVFAVRVTFNGEGPYAHSSMDDSILVKAVEHILEQDFTIEGARVEGDLTDMAGDHPVS